MNENMIKLNIVNVFFAFNILTEEHTNYVRSEDYEYHL